MITSLEKVERKEETRGAFLRGETSSKKKNKGEDTRRKRGETEGQYEGGKRSEGKKRGGDTLPD